MLKIAHDYKVKFVTPKVVKVFYDIETAVFGKSGVPEVQDRNAFITCIGMVIQYPDGKVTKNCLLNNTLRYKTETLDNDIILNSFASESEMCQYFFRRLNELADEIQGVVLAVAHNGSANSRSTPYDLPWIASRSLYNLQPTKRNYRDQYSGTEGELWSGFAQFPKLFFLDTLRMAGQYLCLQKVKIPSLGLDALALYFKITGKADDMSYKKLAEISTTFGSEFGRVASYCV
jgi:hypothetical protein